MADIQPVIALHQQGKLAEAEAGYRALVKANAAHFDAHHLLGVVLLQKGDAAGAVQQIGVALKLNPRAAVAHYNLGNALNAARQPEAALQSFDRALAIDPAYIDSIFNRAATLSQLGRFEEALQGYDRVIALKKTHAAAWYRRGVMLRSLKRLKEAVDSLAQSIALKPDFADAWIARGHALNDLSGPEPALLKDAQRDFERALALNPAAPYIEGIILHTRMLQADWQGYDAATKALCDRVRQSLAASPPFSFLALPSTPEEQMLCAKAFAQKQYPALPPVWQGAKYAHDKIRVAYLSADLHAHATALLMAGLFESHDRTQFETTALSFGPNDNSAMRKRLEKSFDHFIDVTKLPDAGVAQLVRDREIDILVDLKGYTQHARFGILSRRPAPLQVNYLGYPGTLGAPYIDYIIADKILIPAAEQRYYTERVVSLPDTYQPNDARRVAPAEIPTRASAGLPEKGFVFCCFNNSYKITPDVFDIWMRLLKQVEGSVLWLLGAIPQAAENLRKEAAVRGVAPERLVFATYVKQEEHVARQRLADLFLDTLPYNAHTTCSDALWIGLPLLTRAGNSFASRVAASLLSAAGVPELVTHSAKEYERRALELARNPHMLAALQDKLIQSRATCALFDTQRYTRNLEAAYRKMHALYQAGSPSESFSL